ncbi:PKD-like family lipoprotein [Marinifilum sp.]|uniref:PKD-like family lipoprotein n=1 Tax=Marinifilum sp. TaxID=2033137 RepID=UPI003BAB9A72
MKALKKITYIAIACLLLVSCLKDEGNYDYDMLTEIDLSDIQSQTYNVFVGDILTITPELGESISEENLEFLWARRYVDDNSDFQLDTISTDKTLDVAINLAPGNHTFILDVLNTERVYRKKVFFDVLVETPFDKGWVILKEKGTATDFDYYSDITEKLSENVLENITGVNLSGKPVSSGHIFNSWNGYSQLNILSEDGGVFLDATSMLEIGTWEEQWKPTYLELPFSGTSISYNGRLKTLVAGGKIFPYSTDFQNPISEGLDWFELPVKGDYYANGMLCGWYTGLLVYDELNRRYINYSGNTFDEFEEISVNIEEQPFDPNNLQMNVLYMDNDELEAYNGNVVSFLKADDGSYYTHEFKTHRRDGFTVAYHEKLPDGAISDMSVYAVSTKLPFSYMSNGNKIHRYNRDSYQLQTDYITAEGNITAMGLSKDGKNLAVATDNGAGSKITFYDLFNDELVLMTLETDSKVVKLMQKWDVQSYQLR